MQAKRNIASHVVASTGVPEPKTRRAFRPTCPRSLRNLVPTAAFRLSRHARSYIRPGARARVGKVFTRFTTRSGLEVTMATLQESLLEEPAGRRLKRAKTLLLTYWEPVEYAIAKGAVTMRLNACSRSLFGSRSVYQHGRC